jgi:hypothetical protein
MASHVHTFVHWASVFYLSPDLCHSGGAIHTAHSAGVQHSGYVSTSVNVDRHVCETRSSVCVAGHLDRTDRRPGVYVHHYFRC